MTKMLIPKFYFALCISEQFGCTASAAYSSELIDFKNNRNCAVTGDFWLPALLIFLTFCSFCGLLEETALLQLAASLGLAAAHMQAGTTGSGGGRAVPCGADEDQLIVLAAAGAELSPQVSTSYPSLLKVTHRRRVCGFHAEWFWRTLSARTEVWIFMWVFLELAVLQIYCKPVFDKKPSSLSWRKRVTKSPRTTVLKHGMCRQQGFPEPATVKRMSSGEVSKKENFSCGKSCCRERDVK